MGITEQPLAYFLDRAVYTFGARVEHELDAAEKGKKGQGHKDMARKMVFNRWVGGEDSGFASPTRR